MGYAIFTARKLMLTNRINQINFRIMQLSQQQQTLANSAGNLERNLAWAKNMFSTVGNSFMQKQQMMMNMGMMAMSQGGMATGDIQQLLSGGMMQQNALSTMFNFGSQMLDMQSQNELRRVKDMENQIELERKNLETQVKAMTAERDAVEKAEDNEIKNSAPKFA